MASLESLPSDQRAVLQLVLQRGRGYDEIARMLSIDRAGVRDRALSAFDALGPHSRVPAERRALITDYLLGQLPKRVSEQTHDRLAQSASERAWARVLASELAPLASQPLPEIPVDSGRAEPAAPPRPEDRSERTPRDRRPAVPDGAARRPSSRRGGAILLGIGSLVAIVVIVVVIASGGSASKRRAGSTPSKPSTPTTTNGAQLIAQVNLSSPSGTKKTAGVVQVVKQGANTGLVIVAQGMSSNTSHDAYAVWLYNSPSDSHILGFGPIVKSDGKFQTAGVLPANASHFKELLVTLETQAKPHAPGRIVLQGALSLS